jgi:hypothetical protein
MKTKPHRKAGLLDQPEYQLCEFLRHSDISQECQFTRDNHETSTPTDHEEVGSWLVARENALDSSENRFLGDIDNACRQSRALLHQFLAEVVKAKLQTIQRPQIDLALAVAVFLFHAFLLIAI